MDVKKKEKNIQMEKIYLGLSSNIGNRAENLHKGLCMLQKKNIHILKTSSVYETEPVGYKPQPEFYNIVVLAQTRLSPQELLQVIQSIEIVLGRVRDIRFGPRTLDIDILFYGKEIIQEPHLQIPHPRLHERNFVLIPFVEINPDFQHPLLLTSMKNILDRSKDASDVRKLE